MKSFRLIVCGMVIVSFFGCIVACTSGSNPSGANASTSEKSASPSDPLPSWHEGPLKQEIMAYVEDVTNINSPNFVAVEDRIATFDNDGTLWSEQPVYFQFYFAIDRVKAMAADHPEWKTTQPFKAILENNMGELMKQGEKGLFEVMMTTHAGTTTDEFEKLVKDWIATAKHPTKDKLFTEMVYQPMLELLDYLRANDFKTFIVSGGGIEFMRPWVEAVYGIPSYQVVGSSIKTVYDYNNGAPVIKRLPEMDLLDDKDGKPIGINRYIGKKPVFACGNSDGDLQMLRWADANLLKSYKLYIHHTDSIREWAYDRGSHIGGFDKSWDEAITKDWGIVDMEKDWKVVYP